MFNGALIKLQERLKAKLLHKKQSKLAEMVELITKSRVRRSSLWFAAMHGYCRTHQVTAVY